MFRLPLLLLRRRQVGMVRRRLLPRRSVATAPRFLLLLPRRQVAMAPRRLLPRRQVAMARHHLPRRLGMERMGKVAIRGGLGTGRVERMVLLTGGRRQQLWSSEGRDVERNNDEICL